MKYTNKNNHNEMPNRPTKSHVSEKPAALVTMLKNTSDSLKSYCVNTYQRFAQTFEIIFPRPPDVLQCEMPPLFARKEDPDCDGGDGDCTASSSSDDVMDMLVDEDPSFLNDGVSHDQRVVYRMMSDDTLSADEIRFASLSSAARLRPTPNYHVSAVSRDANNGAFANVNNSLSNNNPVTVMTHQNHCTQPDSPLNRVDYCRYKGEQNVFASCNNRASNTTSNGATVVNNKGSSNEIEEEFTFSKCPVLPNLPTPYADVFRYNLQCSPSTPKISTVHYNNPLQKTQNIPSKEINTFNSINCNNMFQKTQNGKPKESNAINSINYNNLFQKTKNSTPKGTTTKNTINGGSTVNKPSKQPDNLAYINPAQVKIPNLIQKYLDIQASDPTSSSGSDSLYDFSDSDSQNIDHIAVNGKTNTLCCDKQVVNDANKEKIKCVNKIQLKNNDSTFLRLFCPKDDVPENKTEFKEPKCILTKKKQLKIIPSEDLNKLAKLINRIPQEYNMFGRLPIEKMGNKTLPGDLRTNNETVSNGLSKLSKLIKNLPTIDLKTESKISSQNRGVLESRDLKKLAKLIKSLPYKELENMAKETHAGIHLNNSRTLEKESREISHSKKKEIDNKRTHSDDDEKPTKNIREKRNTKSDNHRRAKQMSRDLVIDEQHYAENTDDSDVDVDDMFDAIERIRSGETVNTSSELDTESAKEACDNDSCSGHGHDDESRGDLDDGQGSTSRKDDILYSRMFRSKSSISSDSILSNMSEKSITAVKQHLMNRYLNQQSDLVYRKKEDDVKGSRKRVIERHLSTNSVPLSKICKIYDLDTPTPSATELNTPMEYKIRSDLNEQFSQYHHHQQQQQQQQEISTDTKGRRGDRLDYDTYEYQDAEEEQRNLALDDRIASGRNSCVALPVREVAEAYHRGHEEDATTKGGVFDRSGKRPLREHELFYPEETSTERVTRKRGREEERLEIERSVTRNHDRIRELELERTLHGDTSRENGGPPVDTPHQQHSRRVHGSTNAKPAREYYAGYIEADRSHAPAFIAPPTVAPPTVAPPRTAPVHPPRTTQGRFMSESVSFIYSGYSETRFTRVISTNHSGEHRHRHGNHTDDADEPVTRYPPAKRYRH